MKKIRTRVAPSPTGSPHVGSNYIALFNMAFARHNGGDFILRIEDTDQKRSRLEFERDIYEAFKWMGLTWDEGPDIGGPYAPYKQSERTEIYQKYCYDLLKAKKAYKCFTTAEELEEMRQIAKARGGRGGYDRRHRNLTDNEIEEFEKAGRPYVIRLKVPLTGDVVFEDAIKGLVSVPCADIDDQVLLKSDGFPTYHLANVVDDHLMEISHVIRGDEWVSSTAKHILIYEAFGWQPATFVHMPLLLGTDGKKLSKRKNPVSTGFYRDSGYLPEAMCNFLSLMGYSMPEDREVYSLQEFIDNFDLSRVGQSGAVFDLKKLDWINQHYLINSLEPNTLWDRIKSWCFSDAFIAKLMPLVHTRIKTFGEFFELCDFFFVHKLHYTKELLCPRSLSEDHSAMALTLFLWGLDISGNWQRDGIEESAKNMQTLTGLHFKKEVIPILFATFMGKHQGPPLYDSVALLGPHIARARIMAAIEFLGGVSNKKLSLLSSGWEDKDCKSLFESSKTPA